MSKVLPIPTPPLEPASRHLRALIADFRDYEVRESYKPLAEAILTCATEICDAIDRYFVDPDGDRLNRDIIGSLLDIAQRWETWIGQPGVNGLSPISATFHSMLLRYGKGAIKAYRIWRIDGLK